MDQLWFEEVLYDDGRITEWDAVPYVNGKNLIERVQEFQLAAAASESDTTHRPFRGLASRNVFAPAPLLGGDPRMRDNTVPVLRCDCGEVGCAPLLAETVLGESSVVWRNFMNPHRSHWSFDGLGPFEFDRAEYEAAFRR